MKKLLSLFALSGALAFAQYKMEPAGAPASDLPFASSLQDQGVKILNSSGSVYCEIWFRKQIPSGPKPADDAVTLPIAQGTLLGVIRFPELAHDRRGQNIKAGVYTLRYSQYPVNGDHQGVAPQRDFALLVPAADDKDPNSTPGFDALVAMSTKASGTPHPAVLSIWGGSTADKYPNFSKQNDHDWVLDAKSGDLAISIILAGKAES